MSIDKLIKCLELTRSDSEGEALNAIRKANTLRNNLGKTWGELLSAAAPKHAPSPPDFDFDGYPDIEAMFDGLARTVIPKHNAEFRDGIEDFYNQRGYLSEKQHAALCRMYERFTAGNRGR